MPRKRKEKGRPMHRGYPPRIDATPEQMAHAILNAGRPKGPVQVRQYHCVDCRREVNYPETLYNDGRCGGCHADAATSPP